MRTGRIASISDRGFGFFCGDWEEIFFDHSAVEAGEFRLLRPGDAVEYELVQDDDPHRNGLQAHWVRGVRGAAGLPSLKKAPAANVLRHRGESLMPQGRITKIIASRGYGFIVGDHRDVFFHHSSVEDVRFDELAQGQAVVSELDDGPRAGDSGRTPHKGLRAAYVRPA